MLKTDSWAVDMQFFFLLHPWIQGYEFACFHHFGLLLRTLRRCVLIIVCVSVLL